MQKLLALLLAAALLLCGCASPAPQPSGIDSPLTLTEAEQTMLLESAEVLTRAITQSTTGFSTDSAPASNHLQLLSAEDFLYCLAGVQGSGYPNSIYSSVVWRDTDGVFHFDEAGVSTILQDVLGVSEWDPTKLSLTYDAEAREYHSGLEFGAGGAWKCGEILDAQIDLPSQTLTVASTAEFLFPGASGQDGDETTLWPCQTTFLIARKSDDKLCLSFEEMAISDAYPAPFPEITDRKLMKEILERSPCPSWAEAKPLGINLYYPTEGRSNEVVHIPFDFDRGLYFCDVFVNAKTAALVCCPLENYDSILTMTSSDRGQSWQSAQIPLAENEQLAHLYVSFSENEDLGYLLVKLENGNPRLYITRDCGTSWAVVDNLSFSPDVTIYGLTAHSKSLYFYGEQKFSVHSLCSRYPVLLVFRGGTELESTHFCLESKYTKGTALDFEVKPDDDLFLLSTRMTCSDQSIEKVYFVSRDKGQTWQYFVYT